MKPSDRPVDPHADREAAKYNSPIPSREFILQVMAEADRPLSHPQLCQALSLRESDDIDALRKRLRAMERDGQLLVNRRGDYCLVQKLDLVLCRVQGHRDGYGFAIPLDKGEQDDIYLSARQMSLVFDGDEVLVSVVGLDNRGRPEGKIAEVVKQNTSRVVGRYVEEGGIGVVIPDNARVNHEILIPPNVKGAASNGQIVTAEITDYPSRRFQAKGHIVEVLGEHLDPGMEIDVAIRSHDIPYLWPEPVLEEASRLSEEPLEADKQGRVDLRDKPFVTIDGEDAMDFDDAVYCERRRLGGWRLWVAIADVSHYVSPGAPLDEEAAQRGTSVYFPGRVVPMLPEVLSNGLCSLKPGVDRLAMVCEMRLSRSGKLDDFVFYEAVIHSHARLTYNQVWEALESGTAPGLDAARLPDLERLHALYKVLRKARSRRGAIDFETVETRILFDERRKIEAIVPVYRNDAHRLIEECMLCANVAAGRFFEEHGLPTLFRVHEGPVGDRLASLRAFLGELGLNLRGGEEPTPGDYQQLLSEIADRPDQSIIQTMMLRSLSQAVYQPANRGHFGLHYDAYVHFTSPIRRYPDLLVHRGIRRIIRSRLSRAHVRRLRGVATLRPEQIFPYDPSRMESLGHHCSMAERRADEATRSVESWLKCEYLLEHVGEEFDGTVASVTRFGLFVELADLYIEGLVHVSSLPGDYYHFDQSKLRLIGERSGRSFGLGSKVRVQVARVDLDDKKIDLELVEAHPLPVRPGSARKPAKAAKQEKGDKKPAKGKPGKKASENGGRGGKKHRSRR